ncbi:MAG: alkaline phosphatase family protein [Actinomycetota bacterium]
MLPRFVIVLIVVTVVGAVTGLALIRLSEGTGGGTTTSGNRSFDSNDLMERGCNLPIKYLQRIWRGHDPVHSEDVTTVPLAPNSSGTFGVTSHSGPWDYLQNVPLVFYGPGFIKASGEPVDGPVETIDVFPTVGELVGVDLPERDGRTLGEIIEPGRQGPPKLILTIMWDGVGRNVLERWPDAWPNLARLESEGTSLIDAVVGSSPSITPATHSTLGTGAYPRRHGVTAIEYRTKEGSVRQAFAGRNPADLRLTTMADEIDLALNNEPKAGMLAWKGWHLGMLGHGTQAPGGDADEVGLIGTDEHITGNDSFYSTPTYIDPLPGLERRLEEADRLDGKVDGNWRGHPVSVHDNPGWVNYAADAVLTMLERGEYGADEVPDLFFTNFKMSDIAGHQYTMDSLEERDVLHAQDAALGRIVDFLDREVGDYVVVLSADHGHTPDPERSRAWPISQGTVVDDINEHFDVSQGSLMTSKTAVGMFFNRDVMQETGVSASDVARFLNGYTIAENWSEEELPDGYESRGDENVYEAAFPSGDIGSLLRCARKRAEERP